MRKLRLWIITLTISLPIALLFLFSPSLKSFLRAFLLEPLTQSFYVFRWYLSRLPQFLLWAGFILTAFVFFARAYWRALDGTGQARPRKIRKGSSRSSKGGLPRLSREIRAARHRPFYQRRITRRLAGIVVLMIARKKKVSVAEARAEFEQEAWTEDPITLSFFRHRRLKSRFDSGHDFLAQLEATLSFLEDYQQGG